MAGPFTIALYIDGRLEHHFHEYDSTGWGDVTKYEDCEVILNEGYHTIKMVVDYYDEVDEIYEDNNLYEQTYYWERRYVVAVGQARYRDYSQGGILCNARNARVELWDYNVSHSPVFLAETVTDDYGYFWLGPVENIDNVEGGHLDLYAQVYAENVAAKACSTSYPSTAVLNYRSAIEMDAWADTVGLNLVPPGPDTSRGFFAIDHILHGYNKWNDLVLFKTAPSQVNITYSASYPTRFKNSDNCINLNPSVNNHLGYPDDFDEDVIIHEYGHKLSCSYSFFDSTLGLPHNWWDSTIEEQAACEAFSHFWSAYVPNDRMIRNSWNSFQEYLDKNIENGEFGRNDSIIGSAIISVSPVRGL